ncbi:hypothetical protein [Methylobacterium nigriterrae]|uniref:hypothetical protein n=1 Tax=Methylobacterium nigriterrae TaxID=3127512 RepID=UPI003013DB44
MQPHRTDLRASAPTTAKILLGSEVVGCHMREDGAAGACLELMSAAGIPEHFVLTVGAEGEDRLARVTCRKQGENGARLWVQFLGPASLAA